MSWLRKASGGLRMLGTAWRSSGPVMRMELLVASRRRRTYWLRAGYVLALTLVTALVWAAVTRGEGAAVGGFTRSRMAEAGRILTGAVLAFLWVAGPVAAVLLMSNCFADELYHGSLWSLMSTPLGFSQIVIGKFLSRCVQLSVLLIGVLPALSMARVFGGVPWSLVLGQVVFILCTSAFAGALAMLYSTRYRQPYKTIARALITSLLLTLPIQGMVALDTAQTLSSGGAARLQGWLVCGAMVLVLTGATLLSCIQAFAGRGREVLGNLSASAARPRRDGPVPEPAVPAEAVAPAPVEGELAAVVAALAQTDARASVPRRRAGWPLTIHGSPIVWRAMRKRFLLDRRAASIVVAVVMAYVYILVGIANALTSPAFHVLVIGAALLAYAAMLAVLAAGAISSEKESRCWPLLLTTPLTDGQILWAKGRAALWRASLPLMVLGSHAGLFLAAGVIPPIAILHVGMILAGVTAFLLGLGLYTSVRSSRTTAATMIVAGLAAGLWLVLPWVAGLAQDAMGAVPGSRDGWGAPAGGLALPNLLASAVRGGMNEWAGPWGRGLPSMYGWAGKELTAGQFTLVVFWYSGSHVLAGLLLGWLAKGRFRRDLMGRR